MPQWLNPMLLPSSLRAVLPSIDDVVGLSEPFVYAHYCVPDGAWSYYVTGGQPAANDYDLFGFLIGSEHDKDWTWQQLHLSDLERRKATLDHTFQPGNLTDVIPLPNQDE